MENKLFYLYLSNSLGISPFLFKSSNMDKVKYDLNRNQRSKTRDSLIGYINSISISNMDSIRTQIGMISMITAQTDEISRNSEVNVFSNFRIIYS